MWHLLRTGQEYLPDPVGAPSQELELRMVCEAV